MRRLLRVLLPVIVLVPTIALSTPAEATPPNPGVCSGKFQVGLTVPMGLPGLHPATTVYWGMWLTDGLCTGPIWPGWGGGYLTGNCGAATGSIWINGGEVFVVWAGTSLTMTGEAVGTFVTTVPTECAGNGAWGFEVVGAIGPSADACWGVGTFSRGSFDNFSINLSGAASCATSFPRHFSASGTMTGSCGSAFGYGTTSDGEPFDVQWSGNHLLLTGNVVGIVNVSSIAGGCSTGFFPANGAVAKLR